MINKNISIWRGNTTPPTNYHLWEKEDGGLYVYLDEKWQHLVTPADKTILDEHQQQLDKIKNLALTEVDPTDTNTYKSYQLKSDDNVFGTTINIPKDKFIKQVTLGYDNATIDTSTGSINIGTGLTKEYLLFSIALETGNYELISINLSEFITEKDYSDGLEVVNNKLKVKVDSTSEEYLKVSNKGIKVEGINTKVSDTVDDIKNKIQNGEWISIRAGRNTEGVVTTAIAEGSGTADDPYCHAEGDNTEAGYYAAHAEGSGTIAAGTASHAEGSNSRATGYYSHSEGNNTTAKGSTAHAEGSGTIAEGDNTHAEGFKTSAKGNCSHSEGQTTTAEAVNSHAEGFGTSATGVNSHSEGKNTIAQGANSHAQGESTKATGNNSFTSGRNTTASGGLSVAFGENSVASGYCSYASGSSTATNKYAHAENGATAKGDYSHAEGTSVANGNMSHAENVSTANGTKSHAEGDSTTEGDCAHSEGYNTVATEFASHAEGDTTRASGPNSHAEGASTTASGGSSHAEGNGTTASGSCAHAQGIFNYDDKSFIDMVGVGGYGTYKNASTIYAKRDAGGYVEQGAPKNGYLYLIEVGGYKGQEIGDAKSVQEVFADLENNKVDKVEGKSLVSDTDITKLSELPNNATLNTNIADAKKAGTDAQSTINTHIKDTDNPHNVTKAQVGLDQVNNTSDADKPISTATQSALDSKVDKVEGKQLSTNDYTTVDKNKVNESINESTASTLINTAIGKLTKANVGLDNVDNTADANKEVLSATKLKTVRTLWGQSFDGTTNISGNLIGIGNGTTAKLNVESVVTSVDYIHIYLPEARRPLVLQKGYGNVGIGVAAPVEKFEVDGNIKLTGSVKNVTEIYTTDGSKYAEPCTENDIKALFA